MGQFLNEALLTGKGITLSDAFSVGGMVTGVGLAIVFAVLLILMIVLMLFKVIFYKNPEKCEKKCEEKIETVPEVPVQVPQAPTDDELIAVLTAAIAASLNTSTYNLKIRSYRRIGDNKPSWRKAGITETINNRF